MRLRLDREDLRRTRWVVGEVQAVSSADLDHPPLEVGKEGFSVLGSPALLGGTTDPWIDPGENRMAVGG